MNYRSVLLATLGVWLGATLFMWSVAIQNFRVVDAILAGPPQEFVEHAASLEPADLRLLMRHQASEVNRLLFNVWGTVQLLVGAAALLACWRGRCGRVATLLVVLMILICGALQVYVVPETIRLGRILDFLPRDPEPPQAVAFWTLHDAYTWLDMGKFLLGLGCVAWLARKSKAEPAVHTAAPEKM